MLEYLIAMSIVAFIAWLAWGDLRKERSVKNSWRKVKGQITEVGIKEEIRQMPKSGGMAPMYKPAVRYRYTADSREYSGSKISYNNDSTMWYSSRKWAVSRGSKWKAGKIVDVYYDPDNPQRACLVPVTGIPHLYLFFMLLWMIVLTLVLVIMP